jgi:hypothetical protein
MFNVMKPDVPGFAVLLVVQGHLPAEGVLFLDLLQLGMNCTVRNQGSTTAAEHATSTAVSRLPAVLQPGTARRLMKTAADRQHPAASALASSSAVLEHVDAATLASVLAHMHGTSPGVHRLCATPAAGQLDSQAVMQLLLTAVKRDDSAMVAVLVLLPSADQLTGAEVKTLLTAPANKPCGCGRLSGRARWLVLDAPAAQQFIADEATGFLLAARLHSCRRCTGGCAKDLCSRLPAALQASTSVVAGLLRKAITERCFLCTLALLLSPAQLLSSMDVAALLHTAIAATDLLSFWRLCELRAAQQIESRHVDALLKTAVQFYCSFAIEQLCKLPAARHRFSSRDVEALLAAAAQTQHGAARTPGNADQVHELIAAAEQAINSGEVALPSAAAGTRQPGSSEQLCELLAAQQQLSICSEVAALLAAAIEKQQPWTTKGMCQLPAARQLRSSEENVLQAAAAVLQQHDTGSKEVLCKLPAAQQLTSRELASLLLAAVKAQQYTSIIELCRLPAASRISSGAVANLLLAAITSEAAFSSYALFELPAAQQITSSEVTALLSAAIEAAGTDDAMLCCFSQLCTLPAAKQLSRAQVAALLSAAAVKQQPLAQIPAAQLFSNSKEAGELLGFTKRYIKPLCRLPAAQELHNNDISCLQLLQAAVHVCNSSCVKAVCSLPAAKNINSSSIEGLLWTLLEFGVHFRSNRSDVSMYKGSHVPDCTGHLCALPEAVQLRRTALLPLINAATALRFEASVCHLQELLQRNSQVHAAQTAAAAALLGQHVNMQMQLQQGG